MRSRAPFPWFGGKNLAAPQINAALGNVSSYVEPFAGSLACLLTRDAAPIETVNDADAHLANVWRAIQWHPDETAAAADWPVNEADLSARHAHLVSVRASLTAKVMADPTYCDARIAGWWLWGVCQWIGAGWCSGDGPWQATPDGFVRSGDGTGVHRQLPHLGNAGCGVHRPSQALEPWFRTLSARLRRVRVACGDWSRVVTPAVADTKRAGSVGILLDPPYPDAWDPDAYTGGGAEVWPDVTAWCLTAPDSWRIVLCGYEGMWSPPPGWTTQPVRSAGGYQHGTRSGTEVLWCSPSCRREPQLFGRAP